MKTTGKQLVDHWAWATENGLINNNTARALRTACLKVLGVIDHWPQVDVTSLDVEYVIQRFQGLRARDFSSVSLQAYAQRFRTAIQLFLQYVKNPTGWDPALRPAKS